MVGQGPSLQEAIRIAYAGAAKVEFPGARFRGDMGKKGLARLGL